MSHPQVLAPWRPVRLFAEPAGATELCCEEGRRIERMASRLAGQSGGKRSRGSSSGKWGASAPDIRVPQTDWAAFVRDPPDTIAFASASRVPLPEGCLPRPPTSSAEACFKIPCERLHAEAMGCVATLTLTNSDIQLGDEEGGKRCSEPQGRDGRLPPSRNDHTGGLFLPHSRSHVRWARSCVSPRERA